MNRETHGPLNAVKSQSASGFRLELEQAHEDTLTRRIVCLVGCSSMCMQVGMCLNVHKTARVTARFMLQLLTDLK